MASRFFKVVLNQNIVSSNLMLPAKFSREHGGDLSDTAQLTVSDGRVWKMGLSRETGHVSLKNGFIEFAKYYSLGHGHWLVFKYKGRSCFRVRVYDKSNTEISYPCHNPNNGKEENDDAPASDSSESPQPKINVDCKYTSKCGFPTPRHFKSSRPYFEVKLKEYNFDLNFVYVPANLAKSIRKEQVRNQSVWLEVGDRRRWKVSVLERNAGRLSLGRMGEFYLANDLKETDICIFEVVKKNLLRVSIFSATHNQHCF